MNGSAQSGWEMAVQFGAVGAIGFFAICGLIWFVIAQKNQLKESNTKVISLLETTVMRSNEVMTKSNEVGQQCADAMRDGSEAKNRLADAIDRLPCNTEKWRERMQKM